MQGEAITEIEKKIGYRFRQPVLLREALTHKSYSNEKPDHDVPHNERLEFLGDAVLDLVISHRLYRDYPDSPEGELTRVRAEVVSEKSLARFGRELQLGGWLLLGRGEGLSGGRDKDSLLADTLEALLGAVYLDGGLEQARAVTEPMFSKAIVQSARRKAGVDHKTRLQEIFQGRGERLPAYVLTLVEGPDHQRIYTVEVRAAGQVLGCGRGRTKKAAEQEAARNALAGLED